MTFYVEQSANNVEIAAINNDLMRFAYTNVIQSLFLQYLKNLYHSINDT